MLRGFQVYFKEVGETDLSILLSILKYFATLVLP